MRVSLPARSQLSLLFAAKLSIDLLKINGESMPYACLYLQPRNSVISQENEPWGKKKKKKSLTSAKVIPGRERMARCAAQ